MERDPYYDAARKRVKEKKKFRKSFSSFIGVSVFLLAINIFTSPGYMWAFFPIAGMGLGVFIQGMKLYGPLSNSQRSDRQEIEREMAKLKGLRREPIKRTEHLDLEEEPELRLKELDKKWDEKDFV